MASFQWKRIYFVGFGFDLRHFLCDKDMESYSHLFINFPYAIAIWDWLSHHLMWSLIKHARIWSYFCMPCWFRWVLKVSNFWLVALVSIFSAIWFARNQACFDYSFLPISKSIVLIINVIREANHLRKGCMKNFVDDLMLFYKVSVKRTPQKAPKIVSVFWNLPNASWIKINTDEATNGAPNAIGSGGIFYTSNDFIKSCFTILLDSKYAFEANLLAIIYALEVARKYSWDSL